MKKEKKLVEFTLQNRHPKKKVQNFFPISLSKNGEILNPKLGHRSQKFGFVFVLNKISSSALFFGINPWDSFIHSQDVRAQMAKKKKDHTRKAHQMDYFITKTFVEQTCSCCCCSCCDQV
jgi:hypothetical protein